MACYPNCILYLINCALAMTHPYEKFDQNLYINFDYQQYFR